MQALMHACAAVCGDDGVSDGAGEDWSGGEREEMQGRSWDVGGRRQDVTV